MLEEAGVLGFSGPSTRCIFITGRAKGRDRETIQVGTVRKNLKLSRCGAQHARGKRGWEGNSVYVVKEGSRFIPFSFQGGEKETGGRTVGLSCIG